MSKNCKITVNGCENLSNYHFFVGVMNKRSLFSFSVLILGFFSAWVISSKGNDNEDFSAKVKIALRDAGNELLLSNQDSISLIFPVLELSESSYKLAFQNQLSFKPGLLVSQVKSSFAKLDLPRYYRVEVVQCADEEVAYSYEIRDDAAYDIIPCAGRELPLNCYHIEVQFIHEFGLFSQVKLTGFGILVSVSLLMAFIFMKRKKNPKGEKVQEDTIQIGRIQLDPEQCHLLVNDEKIAITRKECELLVIFAKNLNQVVTREELTKKVWEDNNVFVGRSLDTFISRLRGKLKSDESVKITNVHGVGYKLEVDQNG